MLAPTLPGMAGRFDVLRQAIVLAETADTQTVSTRGDAQEGLTGAFVDTHNIGRTGRARNSHRELRAR